MPYTIFLKLRDIGGVLPPYAEEFREVAMDVRQADAYDGDSVEVALARQLVTS